MPHPFDQKRGMLAGRRVIDTGNLLQQQGDCLFLRAVMGDADGGAQGRGGKGHAL